MKTLKDYIFEAKFENLDSTEVNHILNDLLSKYKSNIDFEKAEIGNQGSIQCPTNFKFTNEKDLLKLGEEIAQVCDMPKSNVVVKNPNFGKTEFWQSHDDGRIFILWCDDDNNIKVTFECKDALHYLKQNSYLPNNIK